MMSQMESGQPIREEPGASYGRYEAHQTYSVPPQYDTPYGQGPQYDDEYIDVLAQRLSQRMAQRPGGKIQPTPIAGGAPWGMRLALAIVSVVILVPLAGIFMGAVGGIGGLIGFGAACLAIFLINAVFHSAGH